MRWVASSRGWLPAHGLLDFRNQAQSDLEVAPEVSPLDLRDVADLKAHRHVASGEV